MRVAVVGLFRSGSSYWAKVLHRLGVNMGDHFWENDNPDDLKNHYEALRLAEVLRRLWDEPSFAHPRPRDERVSALRAWIDGRHGFTHYGAKHPLLSLDIDAILEAWGQDTAIIWCDRPREDSIASIRKSFSWADEQRVSIEITIWDVLHAYFVDRAPAAKMDFAEMKTSPASRDAAIERLIDVLGLAPTGEQIQAARNAYTPK